MLSDDYKQAYLDSEHQAQIWLALFRQGALTQENTKEKLEKLTNELLLKLANLASAYIADDSKQFEGSHPNANSYDKLKNFDTTLARSINSFRCVYRELQKMEKNKEIGTILIPERSIEVLLFRHFTDEMPDDIVKHITDIFKSHKFQTE